MAQPGWPTSGVDRRDCHAASSATFPARASISPVLACLGLSQECVLYQQSAFGKGEINEERAPEAGRASNRKTNNGFGKPTQFLAGDSEIIPKDTTLEQLREEILIEFAASFPDLEIVPKKRLTVIAGTDEAN